jgi:hypothetical protein
MTRLLFCLTQLLLQVKTSLVSSVDLILKYRHAVRGFFKIRMQCLFVSVETRNDCVQFKLLSLHSLDEHALLLDLFNELVDVLLLLVVVGLLFLVVLLLLGYVLILFFDVGQLLLDVAKLLLTSTFLTFLVAVHLVWVIKKVGI